MTLKHRKTVTVPDPTQADLNAQIALGNFPPGTTLDMIALGSDFNAEHSSGSALDGQLLTADGAGGFKYSGSTKNVFYPEDFGAKADAVGYHDGVYDSGTGVFTSASYTFTAADLAQAATKKVYFAGTNGAPRTITGLVGSGITVTPTISGISTPGILWLMTSDDTAAVQAACDAARAVQGNDVDEVAAGGIDQLIMSSGQVVLTPGKRYGVFNSSASYNGGAGKISAITYYRRTTFGGTNNGFNQTGLVLIPGSYGHIVANTGAASHTDFVNLSNFTVWGYKEFSPNSLDAIHLEVPYDNFDKVDALSRVENVTVYKAKRHGFYFKGRGELNVVRCQAFTCGKYGAFMDSQYDWKMWGCAFGGNSLTGLRIYGGGGQVSVTKSFYNGSGGGTNDENSANLVLEGDPSNTYRQGYTFFSGFQAQESWGCSVVAKAGMIAFDTSSSFLDPFRSSMGAGSRPSIKAAIYLKGDGACNIIFGGCLVGPSVTVFQNPNWEADVSAVYIDPLVSLSGPQQNRGDIYTYLPTIAPGGATRVGIQYSGTGAVVSGGGATNGQNTGLRINGVACT